MRDWVAIGVPAGVAVWGFLHSRHAVGLTADAAFLAMIFALAVLVGVVVDRIVQGRVGLAGPSPHHRFRLFRNRCDICHGTMSDVHGARVCPTCDVGVFPSPY